MSAFTCESLLLILQHCSNYFDTEYKIAVSEMTLEDCDHFRKEKLRTMEQAAAYERLKAVIPIHPADSTKYDGMFSR